MKIKDLIAELQSLPSDMEILVYSETSEKMYSRPNSWCPCVLKFVEEDGEYWGDNNGKEYLVIV